MSPEEVLEEVKKAGGPVVVMAGACTWMVYDRVFMPRDPRRVAMDYIEEARPDPEVFPVDLLVGFPDGGVFMLKVEELPAVRKFRPVDVERVRQ